MAFTDHIVNNGNSRNNGKGSERVATEGQRKFYADLCKQKGVEEKDVSNYTYTQLDALVKELRAYKPASPGQMETISTKVENLRKMGYEFTPPPMEQLTGGYGGTASSLIEFLIKKETELGAKAEPSEGQITYIRDMLLCPDVPFEDYDIQKKVILEESEGKSKGKTEWRFMSENEFEEEIRSKLTRKEASRLIDTYRGAFAEWRRTRIRPGQANHIRELEDRISQHVIPSKTEWIVNDEGVLEMKQVPINDDGKSYSPAGDVRKLEDLQLAQLSQEEASAYIDLLKNELARKNPSSDEEPQVNDEDTRKDELEEMQDILHKLNAVAGYDTTLPEKISSLLTEGYGGEEVDEIKSEIQDFMFELVREDAIDFIGLITICENSNTAQKILVAA